MMDDRYWSNLTASPYFDGAGEFGTYLKADIHLKRDWMADSTSRYKSATYIHRTGSDRSVDMYKVMIDDYTGVIPEDELYYVIVQEFKWHRVGAPTLEREYTLSCDEANRYYKSLLKQNYYKH